MDFLLQAHWVSPDSWETLYCWAELREGVSAGAPLLWFAKRLQFWLTQHRLYCASRGNSLCKDKGEREEVFELLLLSPKRCSAPCSLFNEFKQPWERIWLPWDTTEPGAAGISAACPSCSHLSLASGASGVRSCMGDNGWACDSRFTIADGFS